MDPLEINRQLWDERVPIHVASRFYDVDAFLGGRCPLKPDDLRLMGDVQDKSLLHLQCHFGQDTLGWARRGAHVTGLDFSAPAIEAADWLAMRAGLPARFVCASVDDAVAALDRRFDRIVTGVGAIIWLPRIREWARTVAELLEPGGHVVLRDAHPMMFAMEYEREDDALVVGWPYFEPEHPMKDESDATYADPTAKVEHGVSYSWNHGVAEIVQALLDAGLVLERLEELRTCDFRALPFLVPTDHRMWRLPDHEERLPLMLGLRARKPGA